MKKIINGKKYDSETAREIGYIRINAGNNLYEIEETLFLKRNGEFFLLGEGGAGTKYAKEVGQNSWCGGYNIIPLSYEKAKVWTEENLSADVYESIFGVVDEGDDKSNATFHLSKAAVNEIVERAIKLLAEKQG